jgi:hypothetical protein
MADCVCVLLVLVLVLVLLLQLDVGFVGAKSFHVVHAGLMVAINTCGYDLLALLMALGITDPSFSRWLDRGVSGDEQHNTTTHNTTGRKFHATGGRMVLFIFVAYHSFVLTGSCTSVLILRHHLMLWAVFAPKVMFDVACWIIYMIIVPLLMIITM